MGGKKEEEEWEKKCWQTCTLDTWEAPYKKKSSEEEIAYSPGWVETVKGNEELEIFNRGIFIKNLKLFL